MTINSSERQTSVNALKHHHNDNIPTEKKKKKNDDDASSLQVFPIIIT